MSTYSPPEPSRPLRPDPLSDLPPTSNSFPMVPTSSVPPSAGLSWVNGAPMLRMEDAVVETVVTHVTRTTTSFAPIPLPRLPPPGEIKNPSHLNPKQYPLANEPSPEDMQLFALNLNGQRVIVQEDNTFAPPQAELTRVIKGPGWTRTLLNGSRDTMSAERLGISQAVARAKGKEVKKRTLAPDPQIYRTPATVKVEAPSTPPSVAEDPPRKKVRGLGDPSLQHQETRNAPFSPLPSPEHEAGPSAATTPQTAQTVSQPTVGSGLELAALFSLPSLVTHFESLPDKLQQQVLMHLLRRSRMPTIQRLYSFAGIALKRDFIALLPHEVAIQILRKVDVPTLATACRVSKKWQKMIDSERTVWQQRMVDDDLCYGLGVDEEEEALVQRRYDALDFKARTQPSKAGTPTEDEPVSAFTMPEATGVDRPVPLKHVYRRRFTSARNWLNEQPHHTSFPGHGTNVVTCLQFDRDKIVSASDDHSINIYNTSTGQLRRRLDGHEGGVWALEYKGDTLVTGSTDRTVRVWDLEMLCEAHVFHGHSSTVRCLQIVEPVLDVETGEYQPPYPLIVTGSRDMSLRVWKLPKQGEPPVRMRGEDGSEIAVPPEHNPFHIHHLQGHTAAVRALAAHGRTCVSGSYDSTVRVWDIVTGQCKHVLTGHDAKVYSIVYDRYRNRCASGSMDNTVKVWDVITGQCLSTLVGHTSLVGLLDISPNYLVSAAADASLRVWDSNTHELKHWLSSHGGAITCFQHDETKVVSGSDGSLKLWDMHTGAYVRDLVVGIQSVWQVSFSGDLLVAASNRNNSTVFDVFDFGLNRHPSGVDDERLDKLQRRPRWERQNPREPRAYQMDDGDVSRITSPPDYSVSMFTSPHPYDHYHTDSSGPRQTIGNRRSSRLANKTTGSVGVRGAGSFSIGPPPRTRRGTAYTRGDVESPTPIGPVAGPSSSHSARHVNMSLAISQDSSFPPIFDEGDEEMDDDDDVKEEPM